MQLDAGQDLVQLKDEEEKGEITSLHADIDPTDAKECRKKSQQPSTAHNSLTEQ